VLEFTIFNTKQIKIEEGGLAMDGTQCLNWIRRGIE